MALFMILFVVAIIVAVVFLVRYLAQPQGGRAQALPPQGAQTTAPAAAPESAKDILKRRYASGEIEREEYLQKLGDL